MLISCNASSQKLSRKSACHDTSQKLKQELEEIKRSLAQS